MKKFKFLKHTADVKFMAYGKTLEEMFANSALALTQVIVRKIKIKSGVKKKILVKGKDNEALLYNFLEEFLFLLDSKEFLLSKIKKIKIKNGKLSAEAYGDKAKKYKFSNDVKAVTYNSMFVKFDKTKKEWKCQVVLDV